MARTHESRSPEAIARRRARLMEKHHQRIERARQLAESAGCTLYQQGNVWRIMGAGVDLLLADLRHLTPTDLQPLQRRF